MAERPILVKAIHSYTPANNDELKFEKGEILTVARKEDGGWWEGTLSNGKTGWFPSNYVEDVVVTTSPSAPSLSNGGSTKLSPQQESPSKSLQNQVFTDSAAFAAQQAEYRKVAFNELLESEAAHLSELQQFWETYMIPLQKCDILTPGEFKIMVGNFPEVIQVHLNSVLNLLKVEQTKPAKDQRIGSIFLENAPKFEQVHKTYCSNHPKAVQIIEKHKEELGCFIEGKGGRKPGILYIITSLSQPFRRLEKYSTSLQEIERYVEEFHADRGDLQRSIEYYKEIQKTCGALRKQKEMELEVLSGSIKEWEGADVSQLGDIIFMNLVYLGYERQPRYFVLFSNTLLILSYNTENNSLVYEGKVPVSGITLRPLVDKDNLINAFEIAGPMIDQITVGCSSKGIRDQWMNHLNSILKSNRFPSFSSSVHQVHFSRSPSSSDESTTTSSSSININTPKTIHNYDYDNDKMFPKCSTSQPKYKYTPSKTPPYVELVAYLQSLYRKGIIQSKSFEYMEALELDFDNIDIECKRRLKPLKSSTANNSSSPITHVASLDISNALDRVKRRQQLLMVASQPTFEFSFCSESDLSDNSTVRNSNCSTASSSPSEYRLTKDVGYPFHKWRWGMSNLCVEKLKSPSLLTPMRDFKGNCGGVGRGNGMIEKSPGELNLDKSRSITFGDSKLYWKIKGTFSSFMSRSQSLPVIKFSYSSSDHGDNCIRFKNNNSSKTNNNTCKGTGNDISGISPQQISQSGLLGLRSWRAIETSKSNSTTSADSENIEQAEKEKSSTNNGENNFLRGRLVRQDAFDYDDGEVENLPDLNDNLVNNAVNAAGGGGGSSFDSGLGDLTPSNRTTQTNFYEEITFEISSGSLLPASEVGDGDSNGGGTCVSTPSSSTGSAESYRSNLYAHWLLKFESSSNI